MTDRDTLLGPGESWFSVGQDLHVAATERPSESLSATDCLGRLARRRHDSRGVHMRLHAGSMVLSLRADVWAVVSRLLLLLALLTVGCGGSVQSSEDRQQGITRECGVMPDITDDCVWDDLFNSYLCEEFGWPENPYGTPEQYYQLVQLDGERHIVHRDSGHGVCVDGGDHR